MRTILLAALCLLLAACATAPLPVEQRAWNACVRAVDIAIGPSTGEPQLYNAAGVLLNSTFADGTPVDFSTYTGPRQYEVSIFYPEAKSLYHCVLMYDPAEDSWKLRSLDVK